MALKLISSGLGKFVKEIVENSKPTVLVEVPKMMESANSINVTEIESMEPSKNMDIAKEGVDEFFSSDKVVPVNNNAPPPQTVRPNLIITTVGSSAIATVAPVITNAGSPTIASTDPIINVGSPIVVNTDPIINVGSPKIITMDPIITNSGSPIIATIDPVITNAGSHTITTIDPIITNVGSPKIATTDPVITNAGSPTIATVDAVITNVGSPTITTTDPIITNVGSPKIVATDPVITNAGSPTIATVDVVITNAGSPTITTTDPIITNVGSLEVATTDPVITNVGSLEVATTDPVITNAGSSKIVATDPVITNGGSPTITTVDAVIMNAGSPTITTTDSIITNVSSPKIITTDPVITNTGSPKIATTDPVVTNVGSPKTASLVNPTESTNCLMDYVTDQRKCEELNVSLKMVFTNSTKCSQTEDWSVELAEYLNSAEMINDLEPIKITAEYIEKKDTTESSRTIESERELVPKCTQTTYIDEETVSSQSINRRVGSEFMETLCSVADGENTAFHKSTKSLAVNESNENFAAAKSSATFYEEQLLRTLNSPSLSESGSSTLYAPSPQENVTTAEQSRLAFADSGFAKATKNDSLTGLAEKVRSEAFAEKKNPTNLAEVGQTQKAAEQVINGIECVEECAVETNLKSSLQIAAVELSSTSFSLEDDNMLSDDRDCLFSEFELNAYSMTFDSEAQLTNYGDVSSTNNVGLVGGACQHEPIPQTDMSQKSMNSIPDLSDLLDVLEEDALKAKQYTAPAVVRPNYPDVVATSPDSTGNGLQLRVLSCAIIVQRMEKKFPQYAHLLPNRKRKAKNAEDSALKKKIRTEMSDKIPLGTNRASHDQPQRPEKSARKSCDFSASDFKRPKSKKRKRSRERREHESNEASSTQAKRTVKVDSSNSLKTNFSNYRIPKLKTGSSNDAKKENTPQRRDSTSTTCKSSDASRNEGNPINSKNLKSSPKHVERRPIDAASSQNLDRFKHCSNRSSGSEKLPGMPVLDDFQEPMNVEVANSQQKTAANTSSSLSYDSSKVIHDRDISNFDSQMTTSINGPEEQDSCVSKRTGLKSILKKKSARLSSKEKTSFADRHSFILIECDNESSSYSKYYSLPERYVLNDINVRYLEEKHEVKRSSLKWIHQCWTECRPILNSKFDFIEDIDKLNKTTFEEHLKELLYSRLRKTIYEIERSAIITTEVEFSIEVFDTSDEKYWKMVLKRKIDVNETAQFKVGDIVSLTLFTKSRKSKGSWKKTLIFGYTEENEVKEKEAVFQKVSFYVLPINEEVKRDQVKVQKIINIGQQLRLFAAFSVIPYSPIVDLFTHKLKSAVPTTDFSSNELIESEQSLAVDQCYEGVYADNPFLYFIDGAPGTGKSCFIVKLIKKLYSEKFTGYPLKILIITQSDASADVFLHRLIKVSNQCTNLNIMRYGEHPSLKKYTLDDANCILQKPNYSFDVDLEKRILEAKINAEYFSYDTTVPKESCEKTLILKKKQEEALVNDAAVTSELKKTFMKEAIIGSADVIVMSRNACYGDDFLADFVPCPSNKGIFNKFSVCIFDDANEISEIDLLIPIMTMVSNLIFIGDSRNPALKDVSVTPFTRLLEKYKKSLPKNVTNFTTQFRVHPKIVDCLSKMNLSINSTPENNEPKLALKPLMIVDLYCEDESLDYSNRLERQAQFCRCIVQNIHKVKEFGNLRIGVLVGNKKLKIMVRHELKSNPEILVDKTAGFCGLEKDIIIVCLPPLFFPEKFLYNAMTRAKRSVIVCGDFSQFKGQTTIEQMVANATRRKCFQRWDKDPCDFPFRTMRLFIKNGEVTT